MDFERAEARLRSEQRQSRASRRSKPIGLAVSAKAKREAEERRRRTAQRLEEQKRNRSRLMFAVRYMDRCDGWLGVNRSLGRGAVAAAATADVPTASTGSSQAAAAAAPTWPPPPTPGNPPLHLRPVSIHGDGDKLSLPPSVLASLAEAGLVGGTTGAPGSNGQQGQQQQPLAFRVGILNKNYVFPSSDALRRVMERAPIGRSTDGGEDFEDDDDDDDYDSDDSDIMMEDDNNGGDGDDNGGTNGTNNSSKKKKNVKKKRRYGSQDTRAYLEEMSHHYVTYTHATVVEFTMDEGQVGLPLSVASALLGDTASGRGGSGSRSDDDYGNAGAQGGSSPAGGKGDGGKGASAAAIPRKRTVDPASTTTTSASLTPADDTDEDDADNNMETASSDAGGQDSNIINPSAMQVDDETKTPGHLAWGAFDVPDTDVEVTLIKLPKGRGCTLVPTLDAVRNGFYNLKDVKLVLEQSLIRTRATLSVNDVVHAWHRGVKFDLIVRDVTPSDFGAVSCINTDIEVDLASPDGLDDNAEADDSSKAMDNSGAKLKKDTTSTSSTASSSSSSFAPGTGYKLSDGPPKTSKPEVAADTSTTAAAAPVLDLLPEPPVEQKDNVCVIQIRGDGATGRRRFDITKTTIKDLFAFAAVSCNMNDVEGKSFRLVTRFPRRVFSIEEDAVGGGDQSLADAGIGQGQELFLVERF
mmetsp:Transcript_1089/g.1826  ORF Transcript_1089/g.1826 Transcript_1089/m.1826 type:complete len:695 (-) Transcript_1089:1574-3658(-)